MNTTKLFSRPAPIDDDLPVATWYGERIENQNRLLREEITLQRAAIARAQKRIAELEARS